FSFLSKKYLYFYSRTPSAKLVNRVHRREEVVNRYGVLICSMRAMARSFVFAIKGDWGCESATE
ncbi:MAG: hypothetical protein ACXV5L_12585, partial [Thermoanaerobaculia bacterium]